MTVVGHRSKDSGQVQIEKGEFAVVCSRFPKNFEFGHFTLLFCRERQRNVPKCKTQAQAIVFLIKTYCLVTFSLPSPLLKPSIESGAASVHYATYSTSVVPSCRTSHSGRHWLLQASHP